MANDSKIALFHVEAFVYMEGAEDRVAALGFWACDPQWLHEYTRKLKLKPTDVQRAQKRFPGAHHLALCWPDSVQLRDVEPHVVVERFGAAPSAGRIADDSEAYQLATVIVVKGWYTRLVELGDEWTMADLLKLVPEEMRGLRRAGQSTIVPKTGIPSIAPDFDSIEDDAFWLDGCTYRVGGGPARPTYYLAPAMGPLIVPLARPNEDGMMPVKKLLTMHGEHDPASTNHDEANRRGYGRMLNNAALDEEVMEIDVNDLRPFGQGIAVPDAMYHSFKQSMSKVKRLVAVRDGRRALVVLTLPMTPSHIVRELTTYVSDAGAVDLEHERLALRNEVYMQITPEPAAQKSLSNALVLVRNYDYATLLALAKAEGVQLVWTGGRALTFEAHFENYATFARFLGMPRHGWRIPEREPDRRSAKRARLARHRGYMLFFDSGQYWLRYTMEHRKLELFAPTGFFGDNLTWVKGLEPAPPGAGIKEPQFDIVEREWREARSKPPLTAARADAHYEQELVFE